MSDDLIQLKFCKENVDHNVYYCPLQVAISAQPFGMEYDENTHTPSQVVEVYCESTSPQFYQDPYIIDMEEDTTENEV